MPVYEDNYFLATSGPIAPKYNEQSRVADLSLRKNTTLKLKLSGKVQCKKEDISEATVILYNAIGQLAAQAKANLQGEFEMDFTGHIGEPYKLTTFAKGYDPKSQPIIFGTAKHKKVKVELEKNTSLRAIYGRVLDEYNNNLSGATVEITGEKFELITLTGADGSFIVDYIIPEEKYHLKVMKLGYETQTQELVIKRNFEYVAFFLKQVEEHFTTITGKVINHSTGRGIPQAFVGLYRVNIVGMPKEELVDSMLTNKDGEYTFAGVISGSSYLVRSIKHM